MSECSSIECNSIDTTYYQRNKDVILNRVKDCYENYKERLKKQARDKHRNFLKKEKIRRENMKERDIIIYLKKRNKKYQQNYRDTNRDFFLLIV